MIFFDEKLFADFDEKCSQEDDWDVDMSVYYDPGKELSIIIMSWKLVIYVIMSWLPVPSCQCMYSFQEA